MIVGFSPQEVADVLTSLVAYRDEVKECIGWDGGSPNRKRQYEEMAKRLDDLVAKLTCASPG